jgi:hypothetical protein
MNKQELKAIVRLMRQGYLLKRQTCGQWAALALLWRMAWALGMTLWLTAQQGRGQGG